MSLDDDMAILARAPLFECFGSDALRLLTFAGERIGLAAGDTLFRRGDRADGGFVVMSGTIALEPAGKGEGKGEAVRAGPSALIGRNALFVIGKRPADARAEAAAEVMRISTALMTRVLREFPLAAAAIHDALDEDLGALTRGLSRVRARLGA